MASFHPIIEPSGKEICTIRIREDLGMFNWRRGYTVLSNFWVLAIFAQRHGLSVTVDIGQFNTTETGHLKGHRLGQLCILRNSIFCID